MRSLSAEAFGRAKNYLMTSGRPLEQARFKYLFEKGSLDEAAVALPLPESWRYGAST